ncbi:NAD(P)H-hydrate dehydratase [Comamonas endophytica]|uniref:Bifunctional NAD(P)H-hydrate repair enzyme n=1 Tax=Comamonas endophytica TaxID=2949090 RepID=A0ABY6GBW0_9BURK|nr:MULTISPECIES: NAD(P)H-hydrate dehydratase [unclassified Acidovorax]MCD2513797.1 NAD(P)H-hydrate dehydratase [Acidovorax sp. D4N7]UYG52200.1 NAD(P)H-hydrate dehydratase [Acidovorax sp. 5MLIR]
MHAISLERKHALHSVAATRTLEAAAAAGLPAHTLMRRAGAATARLALALAPHARHVWIACGRGNNGGDGLEAALCLHLAGRAVSVTWLGEPDAAPADARAAWQRASEAGVVFAPGPPTDLGPGDLCIDALLGIGLSASALPGGGPPRHAPSGALQELLQALRTSQAMVLAVDVPSGLDADTGQYADGFAPDSIPMAPRHTLSLLTLKPGLFTAQGRDACGSVWLDDLGCGALAPRATAQLGTEHPVNARPQAPHASHKGSFGDVAVVGGEGLAARGMGMTGAAWLAARAALHGGAGRVMVALLDEGATTAPPWPELMLRRVDALDWPQLTAVCGCGGGEAVRAVLPAALARAPRLVLDADGLNAVAGDGALARALRARADAGLASILTPHPLEAARLLQCTTAQVQANRLAAAQALAGRYACTVVLKGSGSVTASPGELPVINARGNARLATAGTGDVLAGLIGARLAQGLTPHQAASSAVQAHGAAADHWPAHQALTASALAAALQ